MSVLHDLGESARTLTGLGAEHEDFRRSLRPFLEQVSPETAVRELMATAEGFDRAAWQRLADELGLQGLVIPEELGGSGFGFLELGVVMEELGRVLLCGPFLSTVVLAGHCLLLSDDTAAQAEYLPRIASGELIATVAWTEADGVWSTDSFQTTAQPDGDGWTLTGTKTFVLDGLIADLVIVPAQTDEGVALFLVDGAAAGLTRTGLATMDQTRKQAQIELAATPARRLGSAGTGSALLEQVGQIAAIALAAEQVGGAQRCLEMAVEYAKIRTQFGRVIGSFQAIKHKLANLLSEVESARSAVYYATAMVAASSPEVPVVASLAKAYCSDAFLHAAGENIQVHGGIGFTWEHSAHLYFKRATAGRVMFGDPSAHRDRFATQIGLTTA